MFTNYGSHKSNEELLLAYGFVLEANQNDSFHVALSLRQTPAPDPSGTPANGAADTAHPGSAHVPEYMAKIGKQNRYCCDFSDINFTPAT